MISDLFNPVPVARLRERREERRARGGRGRLLRWGRVHQVGWEGDGAAALVRRGKDALERLGGARFLSRRRLLLGSEGRRRS